MLKILALPVVLAGLAVGLLLWSPSVQDAAVDRMIERQMSGGDELPDYPFEPHYTEVRDEDGTLLRIH